MEKQKTQAVLYAAFLRTIKKVGIWRFKETTLFGSNEADVGNNWKETN